jgi:hypothetical protein
VRVLAVPHFSLRSRVLNDRELRRATAAVLDAAFAARTGAGQVAPTRQVALV